MATRQERNSQQAQDWALKRKQQMERAARIKAERAAAVGPQRGEEGENGGSPGQTPSPPFSAAPGADGGHMLRSSSQPTSDMPLAELPTRATTTSNDRPEWARDFGQQNRQIHGGGHSPPQYENYPPANGYAGAPASNGPAHWDWYQDPQQQMQMPSQQQQQQYYMMQQQQQYYYQQQQQYYYQQQQQQQQQQGGQAYGQYPPQYPPGYPPQPSQLPPPIAVHDGAAAAAARWSNDVPLNQSDGAIGFNRMRQQPRVGPRDFEQPTPMSPQSDAANFFGALPCPPASLNFSLREPLLTAGPARRHGASATKPPPALRRRSLVLWLRRPAAATPQPPASGGPAAGGAQQHAHPRHVRATGARPVGQRAARAHARAASAARGRAVGREAAARRRGSRGRGQVGAA